MPNIITHTACFQPVFSEAYNQYKISLIIASNAENVQIQETTQASNQLRHVNIYGNLYANP